ncbi:cytochrome b5-like heme/steroid-binding domain protein (macronuclear) [Tetrahymena thermophila SB210]|uniref:Cytochrome b5-like heme/steroid-binding domain protein n=1 Tax=Tetrahymena thermophila (strain SB210) TaxID=312017 RepID=Q24FF1_TETTS|nr:cytochrome b5-like heme/steroid-binding domain protein [Tetrahymena thermophila SB210]EAS06507.3 cytochrome b5-like heme/steroid-binding domain protein [Tetrahymena thermophila SB210]|eukprot:XP_001026752.3 cytochrome b5-like heme/steroid-binding domain protein [Tetrahymena thermophila SB210]
MFNNSKTFKNMADVEFISRTQNRLLVVYDNDVYDLSQFQNKHPGGATVIKEWKGKSVDNVIFNEAYFRHSRGILSKLNYYKIGTIEKATVPDPKAQKQTNQAAPQKSQNQQQQQQQIQSKKQNQNVTDQQAQQIAAQKKEQLIHEQNEKQRQALLEQKKLEEQKKIQLQKQLEQQHLQQQQQQAQQLEKIKAQQNQQRQSVQNSNNVQQNVKQSNNSQQHITSEKKLNISPQTKQAQQEYQANKNNEQLSKQISIVLIDDKGSDHTNHQQNNISSQKNMNLYPDNPLQSKDSIIQEKQTPTNSKQFGKNGRASLSSEKSIGRIKDFLMHAESNAVPSTIPLVNPSQFSQRTIQLEEAKKQEETKSDPFDDNFDLEDLYNDEQLKQTIIPQSIKFTIFKLLKAIVS